MNLFYYIAGFALGFLLCYALERCRDNTREARRQKWLREMQERYERHKIELDNHGNEACKRILKAGIEAAQRRVQP